LCIIFGGFAADGCTADNMAVQDLASKALAEVLPSITYLYFPNLERQYARIQLEG